MNPAPSEIQLRTTVTRLVQQDSEIRLIGFCASPGYSGSNLLDINGEQVEVVEVQSPMHFHQLAWRSEKDEVRLICLCPQRDWADQDLRDRLARRDLIEADPWEAVQDLFRAHQTDAQLRRERKLAHWALESRPPQGYPVALGGVLTPELFWKCLLEIRMGLNEDAYDPSQLLMQIAEKGEHLALLGAPQDLVERASQWLAQRGGDLVLEILLLLRRQGPQDTLALGILCEVLYLGSADAAALTARGRLEAYFPDRPWTEGLGRQFGLLMRQVAQTPSAGVDWLSGILERARILLTQLKAEELAAHSLILPQGWEGILERLGQNFLPLKAAQSDTIHSLLRQAQTHRLAGQRHLELSRVEMGLRLLRYLKSPELPQASTVGQATQIYHDELAWVDRARNRILEGAAQPSLRQAFQALLEQVGTRRQRFNESFAQFLGEPLEDSIGVESFLDRIAAPLAKQSRLLILVLDGCSQAALIDLLRSLEEREWVCYLPDDPAQGRMLSALPSVTEVARTSLLSGGLRQGQASNEKEALSQHSALRAACSKDYPPQLFHKKDLLQAKVYERLKSDSYRVVTVVVNAIDDTLAKEEQLNLNWSTELIAPLENLLHAARFRNRLILLVSDHGHLLEGGTQELSTSGGAGNRWQPGSEPQEGAVVVSGGRLQLAEQARLLWSEKHRYGPKKRGYHGGASPQEMVCALALIGAPGQKIIGWKEGRRPAPSWWDPLPRQAFTAKEKKGQLELFREPMPLGDYLKSLPGWRDRCKALPPPPQIEYLVSLLAEAGEATLDQLTSPLGLSRPQLQTVVPQWMRWLNPLGEPVLNLDGDRLRLDREVLQRVFG